jgi:hypothetical protein
MSAEKNGGAHVPESLPGQPSLCFSTEVGRTYPAASFPAADRGFDPGHFPSEGVWAFCAFDNDEITAVRMGFQKGSFNITPADRPADPGLLQLHLEVMTANGAILWLPTGQFPARDVTVEAGTPGARLARSGREIFRIGGWPEVQWAFCSDDGELEVALTTRVDSVSILPDCLLPWSVFAMWESLGATRGTVRHRDRTVPVSGAMFMDHPRVIRRQSHVVPRTMYLYTTLALDGGGGLYGYHAVDASGAPMGYYCFGIYVDPAGKGWFLPDASIAGPQRDRHGLPRSWTLDWQGDGIEVSVEIAARESSILRSWGSPRAPRSVDEFSIIPLVLDGKASVRGPGGAERKAAGRGLAEYYDASLWPA